MTSNRLWVIGGCFLMIVILALGGLLGVKPQFDAAQLSDSDRESVEALNAQQAAQLAALKEQSARLGEYQAAVGELRTAIPATADLDTFTGELAALQGATGAVVTNYSPEDAGLFVPSAEAEELTPASVLNDSFVKVGVSITVEGTRAQALAFVKGLQAGPRLVLVTDLVFPEGDAGTTSADIKGLVYFLMPTPYVDPNAVPTPAPTETPAP